MEPLLKKYTLEDIDYFYSLDIEKEHLEESENLTSEEFSEYMEDTIRYLSRSFLERDPRFKDIVELHEKKLKLKRKAILNAHGLSIGDRWVFYDGYREFPVQDWINLNDGKYSTLILYCCNPGSHEIVSRRSVVIAPNEVYSGGLENFGKVQMEIYLPKRGYLDSYVIDYELQQMRSNASK